MHKEVFDSLEAMVKKHCASDGDFYYSHGDKVHFDAMKLLCRYGRMEWWFFSGKQCKARFRKPKDVKCDAS